MLRQKFSVVLKVWKCDKIQYFEHYSVKASCDLYTMFKCLCMELNVSASLSVGTVLYLCVIKHLCTNTLPVWMHLSHTPVSARQKPTGSSWFWKITNQGKGFRNARGALLCSITMIHLHKTAKLVIIALANPCTLWANKHEE